MKQFIKRLVKKVELKINSITLKIVSSSAILRTIVDFYLSKNLTNSFRNI